MTEVKRKRSTEASEADWGGMRFGEYLGLFENVKVVCYQCERIVQVVKEKTCIESI